MLQAQRWQVGFHNRQEPGSPLGVQSSTLGLTFQLERSHFPGGRLELRCRSAVANVAALTKESTAIAVLDSNQKLAQRAAAAGLAGTGARWSHGPWKRRVCGVLEVPRRPAMTTA
ncbi:hypothetical protein ONE63_004400 [Megalurothrips usitatus]|uniref:Uncharacterized protein n=1 Tax=Megalurothrips usitatus TaxID=439358 RepID=A0AAV7X685_9NEOP|nr:hypothetical protein ONE63_004400 [Megalurothrips usitatus]